MSRKCVASSLLLGTGIDSSGRRASAVKSVGTATSAPSTTCRRCSAIQRMLTLDKRHGRMERGRRRALDVQRDRLQQQLDANDEREHGDHHCPRRGHHAGLCRDQEVPEAPDRAEKRKGEAEDDVEGHGGENTGGKLETQASHEAAKKLERGADRRL